MSKLDAKTKNNIKVAVFGTLVSVTVFCLIFQPWLTVEIKKKYDATWQLVMDGEYEKAKKEFELMNRDYYGKSVYTYSFFFGKYFCDVCIDYEKGEYRAAKEWMDYKIMPDMKAEFINVELNKEQLAFVKKKINAVEETYSSHKAEYDEEDRKNREELEAARKRKAEEEEAKKKEAPYVGMSESQIDSTDLGMHSEYHKNFNVQHIKGEIYHASMYYWNSGSECIYSARCVDGKVYNIWDNRDRHVKNNIVDHTGSSYKKKKKQESTTEFDPDDHDIEQYYEDYKEEFEDIDDAYDDFEDNPEYWDDY